jgi:hypothetical protein
MDAVCAHRTMDRGVVVDVPFAKSGGYSATDPKDAFARWYLSDPVLRLPAGRWRIVANLVAYVGTCTADGAHTLAAPIEVLVAA